MIFNTQTLTNENDFQNEQFKDIHAILFIVIQYLQLCIDLISRVFANDPGDWGSIPGRVIPKAQKMVLDAILLNTQHYKVRIKSKVEQS